MAKFIKFPILKSTAQQPLGPSFDVLINVEDIAKIACTGATGANPKTLIISFKESAIATPNATNPKIATFTVHTGINGTGNPTLSDGKPNVIYDAVVRALTANPGGVVSTVSLGKDQAATPAQMYFSTVAYS